MRFQHCARSLAPLVARLTLAAVFIFHGMAKWQLWSAVPSEQMPASMLNLMKFLSIVEPLGGVAMLFGFLSTFASAGLALIMLGAIYFKQFVWGVGFVSPTTAGWEFDLTLLALALVVFFSGPGCVALDNVMCRKFCKGKHGEMMEGGCCSGGACKCK